MTNIKYYKAIELLTPLMQCFYRGVREKGFDRAASKRILETAIKFAMIDEAMDGIDKDVHNHIKE